jgi:hypothetical protein
MLPNPGPFPNSISGMFLILEMTRTDIKISRSISMMFVKFQLSKIFLQIRGACAHVPPLDPHLLTNNREIDFPDYWRSLPGCNFDGENWLPWTDEYSIYPVQTNPTTLAAVQPHSRYHLIVTTVPTNR